VNDKESLYYERLIRLRDKLVEKILEEPQNRKVAKALLDLRQTIDEYERQREKK